MTSRTTAEFWKLFRGLPPQVRRQAYKAYRRFQQNPFHPGLNFKEVDKKRHIWPARIARGYRALGRRTGDEIVWTWIGSHAGYDQRI